EDLLTGSTVVSDYRIALTAKIGRDLQDLWDYAQGSARGSARGDVELLFLGAQDNQAGRPDAIETSGAGSLLA
ncbi:MAG: hypothetical protein ACYC6I_11785, partial [Bacillota bacterium]